MGDLWELLPCTAVRPATSRRETGGESARAAGIGMERNHFAEVKDTILTYCIRYNYIPGEEG